MQEAGDIGQVYVAGGLMTLGQAKQTIAHSVTNNILDMLMDRAAFDEWWDDIDPDIQDEIRDSVADLVVNGLDFLLEGIEP